MLKLTPPMDTAAKVCGGHSSIILSESSCAHDQCGCNSKAMTLTASDGAPLSCDNMLYWARSLPNRAIRPLQCLR